MTSDSSQEQVNITLEHSIRTNIFNAFICEKHLGQTIFAIIVYCTNMIPSLLVFVNVFECYIDDIYKFRLTFDLLIATLCLNDVTRDIVLHEK
jgi:hypothetical protein